MATLSRGACHMEFGPPRRVGQRAARRARCAWLVPCGARGRAMVFALLRQNRR